MLALQGGNMTAAELRYLIATGELYDGKNGVKLTDIAQKVGVSKVSVYRAVERLEKNGYVERNDKNKVVLTQHGKNQISAYMEIIVFIRAQLLDHCGTPSDTAYNDALGVACALSDASREKITEIINTRAEKRD
jgi:Mn-dependent DtxR family transcriptional regulator